MRLMKRKSGSGPRIILIWLVGLICLFGCAPISAQTPDQVEKDIANLPPAQRAWERFRFWISALPPEQHQPDKVDALYRAYLKSRGFSDADAEAQLKLVNEQGARAEVERWNQILTAPKPRFNTKPNAFLMEMVKDRKPGTALDVG